jgi:hypothetical protein
MRDAMDPCAIATKMRGAFYKSFIGAPCCRRTVRFNMQRQ